MQSAPSPTSREWLAARTTGLDDQAVFESVADNYDVANHARGSAEKLAGIEDDFVDRSATVGPSGYGVDRLRQLLDTGLDHLVFVAVSRDADPAETQTGSTLLGTEVPPPTPVIVSRRGMKRSSAVMRPKRRAASIPDASPDIR